MKTKLSECFAIGHVMMDRRLSNSMLPWLLREIRSLKVKDKISIVIEDGWLKAFNINFEPVIVHRLVDIIRASPVPGKPKELFYIYFSEKEALLHCYLFEATSDKEVSELFSQMRESPGSSRRGSASSLYQNGAGGAVTSNVGFNTQNNSEHLPWSEPAVPRNCSTSITNEVSTPPVRSLSNASALTSLCVDLSPTDSHFFEVLYIGKVRISQRRVPESLIDDALYKFAQHEAEKARTLRRHSLLSSTGTSLYSGDSVEEINEKNTDLSNNDSSNIIQNNITIATTPLNPEKSWKSSELLNQSNNKTNEVDQEFDAFTKERVVKNGQVKKPSIPLEPSVLILNIPLKNNLSTLSEDEEKNEDIRSVISETASSITQFCQTNLGRDETDPNNLQNKSVNPFSKDLEDKKPDTIGASKTIEKVKDDGSLESLGKTRQDSPAPLNFKELPIKPKKFSRSNSGYECFEKKMPENKLFLRDRSASIGTISLKTPIAQVIGEQNRTMLFQVGRSELRLISPDRKQVLLHRNFKDVASCVLGRMNTQHFGFVCRDNTNTDSYACYVFKCESDDVALEVVNAIKQAFIAHAELVKKSRERSPNMSCEHCPMLWYHRLCHDLEGMSEKRAHAFILRRIEQLSPEEQESLVTKYQAATAHVYEVSEHNSFLMMLLRAHCEAKQQRHVHDTAENRSEFLNQYLGGSTIFMKAKRSLSSGFDHLLKRKASRDDLSLKKEPSPLPTAITESSPEPNPELLSPDRQRSKSLSPAILSNASGSETPLQGTVAPSPSTDDNEQDKEAGENSSMINIFLKVSDRGGHSVADAAQMDGTWRQAIYRQVITAQPDDELSSKALLSIPSQPKGKRTKEELKQLWRMAIQQTVLLVRMERENARLIEKEATSAVRRIKLEYVELGACDAGVQLMWDSLLSMAHTQPPARVDRHMLTQAVMRGVPRMSRGSVWYFLAEQATLRAPPPDVRLYPQYHTPYHTLLAGLTKHQHAILIDLGRTFPQHSYFASALGPGQLALYNVLKAYSLLDPDVGYCQGLSFVAGVLLLHMEETDAFVLLRHLMFRRGLRKQYLPDMSALQVQMYQLSRLLRDHEPELHARLESLEISPALYAAPWMLTLFTSQFPLGFVVRVFDLIFLESLDVIFSISLALLSAHRDGLMLCESCEEAAEYLKHKLPDVDTNIFDRVMKKVHTLDINRQLSEYAVEYAVLREEMPRLNALTEENSKLQAERRKMWNELDSAMEGLTNYQTSQTRLESQNRAMEQQLQLLSKYVATHTRQDLPPEVKKIVNSYNKKNTFGSKIFSSKSSNNDEAEDTRRNLTKTGTSTPNLFSKITKDDLMNAMKEEKKNSPEENRRHFMMKKSQSVHSGLIARQPLKILEENENEDVKIKKEDSNKIGREKDAFSEFIEQERKFEKQLKHDFDENLKRLDVKHGKDYLDDLSTFQSRKSMSLNIQPIKDKMDSGFVTPITPDDRKFDSVSSLSHPLSDCDVDIKFDCQSTILKQIRPLKHNSNASSIDLKQV